MEDRPCPQLGYSLLKKKFFIAPSKLVYPHVHVFTVKSERVCIRLLTHSFTPELDKFLFSPSMIFPSLCAFVKFKYEWDMNHC